jgi:anthraniloyl-CoA monooxygenase
MRILILGAGPGGLYAGALLKQADPRRQVTIVERNPHDATYGWGVVFSDQTLGSLQAADPVSHARIVELFARWDALDVYLRGRRLRAYGNVFAGMSRQLLLLTLQARCTELGVEMQFETEVDDLAITGEYDLVVAADGVNSLVRRTFADVFRPTYDTRTAKYVWWGTDLRPEAFTYIVEQTKWGLFQGTIYPFADDRSTFIVECSEATWRAAGLDAVDESCSKAFCERVFAGFLGDHHLLSNRSLWLSFVTVKNQCWRHKNIVLLGDAAHTAHFTIGSGTKMAMEDAIALADACSRFDDVGDAATFYERSREPVVEATQEAARQSYTWFESLDRYARLDAEQFMFNFLTRSGRITYDDVRVRDPRLAERVDRWYATHANGVKGVVLAPAPVFATAALRGIKVANRAVLAAVSAGDADDGLPGPTQEQTLLRLAAGGPGLVLTEVTAVSPDARITPGDTGIWNDTQRDAWAAIVARAHDAGPARVGLVLGHAGRRGATRPRRSGVDLPLEEGAWPLLAASALPYTRRSQVPREATVDDLDAVVADFAAAARRAAEAGFDVLEINAGHGYLLGSFLSPLSNQRTDDYGGDLAGYLRFPLAVIDAVRAVWPDDRPLVVAFNATDWHPAGVSDDDVLAFARAFAAHGCDVVDVLAGQTTTTANPVYGSFFLAPHSEGIRHDAGVPTLLRGRITTTDHANTVLAAGRADLCLMDPQILEAGGDLR